MIFKHTLTIYDAIYLSKLYIIKILSKYIEDDYMCIKFLVDLIPSSEIYDIHNSFQKGDGEIDESQIKERINHIQNYSKIHDIESSDKYLKFSFKMDSDDVHNLIEDMKYIKFDIEGLQEYRNEKIDKLLK